MHRLGSGRWKAYRHDEQETNRDNHSRICRTLVQQFDGCFTANLATTTTIFGGDRAFNNGDVLSPCCLSLPDGAPLLPVTSGSKGVS